MGFRAPLQIDGFAARVGLDPATGSVSSPSMVRATQPDLEPPTPRLSGPYSRAEASTCTALAITPGVIWDVNYYYRVHGFTWPFRGITVRDLRLAYHERGGRDDPYMTMALLVLRDPARRRAYDASPLGQPVMDRYYQEMIKNRARRKAADLSRKLGFEVDPEEVLQGLGVALESDVSAGQDTTSTPPAEVSDLAATVFTPWSWSFYQLGSTCDDPDRLGRWQEVLVQAFNRVGASQRFCVGFVGRQPHPWVSGEVHERLVIFLNEKAEPTEEVAAAAVASLTKES